MCTPMEMYLRINLGNDHMRTSHQLAEALRRVASRLEESRYLEEPEIQSLTRGIMDANGNTVGEWSLR